MTWCPPNEPPKPTKKLPVLAEKVESFVSTSSLSASCYVWPIKNSKGTNAIMQICKRCAFDQQTVEYVLGCFRSRAPPPTHMSILFIYTADVCTCKIGCKVKLAPTCAATTSSIGFCKVLKSAQTNRQKIARARARARKLLVTIGRVISSCLSSFLLC